MRASPPRRVVGMEQRRAMVTFDDRECAARTQNTAELPQGCGRIAQVLEDEAHEDVVEGGLSPGHVEEVSGEERDIHTVRGLQSPTGLPQGALRTVHGDDTGLRAGAGEPYGLSAHTAPRFQDATAGRIGRVVMKELGQCLGLVRQALPLTRGVAVDVGGIGHGPLLRGPARRDGDRLF